MSTPQIIREVAELGAADPDGILVVPGGTSITVFGANHIDPIDAFLPAVVIATGAHVRAARKALEELE